jgi:hypothetical protein
LPDAADVIVDFDEYKNGYLLVAKKRSQNWFTDAIEAALDAETTRQASKVSPLRSSVPTTPFTTGAARGPAVTSSSTGKEKGRERGDGEGWVDREVEEERDGRG